MLGGTGGDRTPRAEGCVHARLGLPTPGTGRTRSRSSPGLPAGIRGLQPLHTWPVEGLGPVGVRLAGRGGLELARDRVRGAGAPRGFQVSPRKTTGWAGRGEGGGRIASSRAFYWKLDASGGGAGGGPGAANGRAGYGG